MNIYLIRHGKLYWDDNIKKCIGITDIDLSNEGIIMAQENGHFLEDKNINKIYTSDLKRCKKTAQIISEKLQIPYYIEKELREINMGIWENTSFQYIKAKYAKDYENRGKYIDTFKVEGGETFEQCYKRSVNILNELCNKNKNKNIVLVCHSGIIKCLICYIKQIPLKDIMTIKLNYGQITSINYENEKYTIY